MIVAAGALCLEWLLLSLVSGQLIEARSAIYQYGMTAALFPILAWLFLRWRAVFLQAE